jgi:hypothetical protein
MVHGVQPWPKRQATNDPVNQLAQHVADLDPFNPAEVSGTAWV